MNKLMSLAACLALSLALGACAGEQQKDVAEAETPAATMLKSSDPNVVTISVPTIQCETCAETITAAVEKIPATEKVSVDVAAKTVFVQVSSNTPEVTRDLEGAISEAGYSTASQTRNAAAYDKLPDCCKEGGMK